MDNKKWPDLIWTWRDADKAAPDFTPGKGPGSGYARSLAALARRIKKILLGSSPQQAEEILIRYSQDIQDWAKMTAANMLRGVSRDNLRMFQRQARRMGLDMRLFLYGTDTGEVIRKRIEANAELISTIPKEAAKKAGELAHQSLITGARPETIAKEIEKIGKASAYNAQRIARTETSKAYAELTKARAQSIGSEGYIWRTGRDGAVRPSHRAMEGKFVRWDEPPTLDNMTGHAGEFPNCRCHAEPVIPRAAQKPFFQGLATQAEEKESGEKRLTSKWEQAVGSNVIPHMPGEALYNVEKAKFEPKKLTAYSMNRNALNPDGTPNQKAIDKARNWKKWLEFTDKDAAEVERQVMAKLHQYPAIPKDPTNEYGQRFNVYIPITGMNGKTVDVMTGWIYDRDVKTGKIISTKPRLTNCFIDHKIDENGRYKGYKN